MSVLASRDIVVVYVECWDDVAFWRNIFDDFENDGIKFELMPPVRSDLAKGKKAVLDFIDKSGPHLFLAIDSDFDWIFDGKTRQSLKIKQCNWIIQTYAYSIENLQCVPSSLSSVLSKITRIDFPFFDFKLFFTNYSKIIFKLFVWYVWSAFAESSYSLPLSKFSKAIKINLLDASDNGIKILNSIAKSSDSLLHELEIKYPEKIPCVTAYADYIRSLEIDECNVFYYIQGHTFKDCVVKRLLTVLSENIIESHASTILSSGNSKSVVENELNCYRHSTKSVESVLSENIGYKRTKFYDYITSNIKKMINERKI